MLKSVGFNSVLGSGEISFLDAAKNSGMVVLAAAPGKDAVRRGDGHPALWAWLLEDEPELKRITPGSVVEKHRALRNAGAKKPTAITLFQGYAALDYANLADITICDHYPIPWQPLCVFGQHLRMVRLALGKEKPLVAIIQAFDWRYYPDQFDTGRNPLRAPTYEEIRCMTYCALAQGVNGLMYYSYDDGPGRWRMPEHPETWAALCQVVKEVNERLPLFKARQVPWVKEQRWEKGDQAFNAVWMSSIDSVLLYVKEGNQTVPAGFYIMAVNNTDQQHVYRYTLPFPLVKRVAVMGENREVEANGGWLEDSFRPYAVHVYGPLVQARK